MAISKGWTIEAIIKHIRSIVGIYEANGDKIERITRFIGDVEKGLEPPVEIKAKRKIKI